MSNSASVRPHSSIRHAVPGPAWRSGTGFWLIGLSLPVAMTFSTVPCLAAVGACGDGAPKRRATR